MLPQFVSFTRRNSGAFLFVLGFVLLCSVYEYGRVMNLRPSPHHLSRQTSGLSFAYTYWEKGNGFFEPELQHLFADDMTTGRTVAELPLLYYVVAQIWRITGPSEFVYRALMLLLHFAATYALFRTLQRILGHAGWAVMVALFFFTSPAIVYFAIAFMPDVPSFDLVLLGLAVFLRRWPEQGKWDVLGAALLFTLAALLKVSALMAPLALFALLAAETVLPNWFSVKGRVFQHRLVALVSFVAMLAITYAWYAWSMAYTDRHQAVFSNSTTWALWDIPKADALKIWQAGKDVMVWQLFDTPAWIAFGLMLTFLFLNARRVAAGAWLLLACLAGGIVLYTLLWFITLDAHEYYFINPMVLPILLVGVFLWTLGKTYPKLFNSPITRVAFALLLCYHTVYAANNHRMRTRGRVQLKEENYLPIYHPAEVHFWDMAQYWDMEPMLTITQYNRSIGIKKEDPVMCMTDATICASLYFMDQRGWTTYSFTSTDTASWNARIRAGAKYLFVKEGQWEGQSVETAYMTKQIGAYKGILIYDLRAQHP